jgi:ABC-type hemin transport system substrate-binding protein
MTPKRIVSLVPSLTEALFAFGVGERVVGRTRYCLWPPRGVGRVAKVGGTKKVDVRRVLSLEPDLVVAVREENTREDVEALMARASRCLSVRRRRWRGYHDAARAGGAGRSKRGACGGGARADRSGLRAVAG